MTDSLSGKLKLYVGCVMAAGACVLVPALWHWDVADPGRFLLFLSLALCASMLKVKLHGISGTYSLNAIFVLIGVLHFSLPETVIVGCAGALVQNFWNAKQRPHLVQVLFNLGNVSLSIGLCHWLAHGPLVTSLGASGTSGLAAVVCLFFVVNTGLVSGVLSLLQGKSLADVSRQWYLWSFPYYLLGAVFVSLLPLSGQEFRPEALLLLLPLLFLIHFFYGLSLQRRAGARLESSEERAGYSLVARLYFSLVIAAGLSLLIWGGLHWESEQGIRLVGYLAAVVVASTLKVRLPGMTGTISVNFVVLLAGIVELSLSEVTVIAAIAALVQIYWKPKRRPQSLQVVFSMATMVLSAGLGYAVCRLWLASGLTDSLLSLLVVATAALYLSNTLLVSLVWRLAEARPFRDIWQRCCFWSLPYYLVGAAFAALMVSTSQSVGWRQSFLVLPLMLLVYVTYRLHVDKAAQLVLAPIRAELTS
jgi:hypothetical protein